MAGHKVVVVPAQRDEFEMPVMDKLISNFNTIHKLIIEGKVAAAKSVGVGGIAAAITQMTFGENLGFEFTGEFDSESLFACDYGTIILELNDESALDDLITTDAYELGTVTTEKTIVCGDDIINLAEAEEAYTQPLEQIFPTHVRKSTGETKASEVYNASSIAKSPLSFAKPRIFIPVFPGTNCEYDTAKAFNRL